MEATVSGSGTVMAEFFGERYPELAEVFDIVGWDPRGVSGSSRLECDEPLQAFYALDNDPDDTAELAELERAAAAERPTLRRTLLGFRARRRVGVAADGR